MGNTDRAAVLRRAIEACVEGDAATIEDVFTEDVTAWSPTIFATSRAQLIEATAGRDESFGEHQVQIDALDVFGSKGVAEFRVTARFVQPFGVGDAVVEPNGRMIVIGAAVVADFDGDRIKAFRNYFDEATLLDQMIMPA